MKFLALTLLLCLSGTLFANYEADYQMGRSSQLTMRPQTFSATVANTDMDDDDDDDDATVVDNDDDDDDDNEEMSESSATSLND